MSKDKVIYEYKGKEYSFGSLTKVKILGVWHDAVIYHCEYENPDGMVWVRGLKEFRDLFKYKYSILEDGTVVGEDFA